MEFNCFFGSFYYSLVVTDYRKSFVFVLTCGMHILWTFLSKSSITWLLAVKVKLNAVTLPVVPFSLVFQSSTFSKAVVIRSSDGEERERIAIHRVTRSLSHCSVMLLHVQVFHMHVPYLGCSKLWSWISRAQTFSLLCACVPLKVHIYPEELSRNKWTGRHSAQNVCMIRESMLTAWGVQGGSWRPAIIQYCDLSFFTVILVVSASRTI